MLPVTKIVIGLVLAFGHFRVNGFDLLFDPVGWGLCAAGLSHLQRSPADLFGRVGSLSVAMACLSLVASLSSSPVESPLAQVIAFAATAGALITVWLIVEAVIRRVRRHGDHPSLALLDALRWVVTGTGALGLLAGYGYADLGVFTAIAWFVALVALVVVLYRLADLVDQPGGTEGPPHRNTSEG